MLVQVCGVTGRSMSKAEENEKKFRVQKDAEGGGAGAVKAGKGEVVPFGQGHPLKEMLYIAAPTVVTMTSYTVMQFIDGLMVSRIGPDPVYVASQGNGALLSFVPISVMMGLVTAINTYVSQNLGAGRPREGASYAWAGLWMCLVVALLMVPYGFAIPWLASILGHEPEMLRMESGYARILIFGGFFTMATRAIAHYFYGMHRAKPVMVAALVGNAVNVGVNYVLIFGHAGFPEMGILGAAIGTVVGSAVEFCIPMLVFLSPSYAREFGTRSAWRVKQKYVIELFRVGWPGGLMFANEMLCWGYLMAYLLGAAGAAAGENAEVHNAVGWIALRYMHVSFMPAVGLSIAVSAIVGRCIGMGRPDLAARRTWLGLSVTMAYMGLCALAFVVFREPMIQLFVKEGTDPEQLEQMIRVGSSVMIAAAVFQLFDAVAITITGTLRGAGDTVWPGVATVVISWLGIVLGGNLMVVYFPELGSLGPWIGASAYIVLLGTAVFGRFLSGKWKNIDLLDRQEEDGRGDGTVTSGDEPLTVPSDVVAGTTPGTA